jgi:hypothetical protein
VHIEKKLEAGIFASSWFVSSGKLIKLIRTVLKRFNMNYDNYVVGITTDGALVMKKTKRIRPCEQQLFFAHAI